MAWRLLVSFLVFSSCLLAFDYEVIRNHDGDNDYLSLYLNNREYLSVLGSDPITTKRLYQFVARLLEQTELQNDPESLFVKVTNREGAEIYWRDCKLIQLTEAERALNEKRGNAVSRLRDFTQSIRLINHSGPITIPLQARLKFKSIDRVQFSDLGTQLSWSFLPASHPFLPLGTRLRVMNPNKDWSIVVQIVKHDKWVIGNALGLNNRAIRALGLEGGGAVKTQFI